LMPLRLIAMALVFAMLVLAELKVKVYAQPSSCISTYHLEPGRVLTSDGLIEDPRVNSIVKQAVAAQMQQLKITEVEQHPGMIVRFMGGTGAGLQVDDLMVGNVAMWNLGGPVVTTSRSYKKSTLVIGVLDGKSNQTLWAARYSDNFGDPEKLQERIQKGVAKAFSKFPKKIACS
jgi:Domain of unknown function (DUF4136)